MDTDGPAHTLSERRRPMLNLTALELNLTLVLAGRTAIMSCRW
jgi:hypothetical protein